MSIIKILKQKLCWHDWRAHNFFIYNPDIKPKSKMSDIKKRWLYETIDYMKSIGLDGLLPYFFYECKKCGKETTPGIDTLIKATITDWYIPKYIWTEEDYTHSENRHPEKVN